MTLPEIRKEATDKGVAFKPSDTIANIRKKISAKELNEKLAAGDVPDDQLKEWKRKFGKIHEISVEVTEGETAVGYLKPPTRDHKAIALSMFNQNKILETGEFLIQNCWLGGDDRLRNREEVSEAAAIQANSIVNFLKGSSRVI